MYYNIYIRYKSHFVAFTGLNFRCPSNSLASASCVLTYNFHTGRAFQVVGIFHSHGVCPSISIVCIVDGQGPHQANDTRHNLARFLHHDLAILPPDHISFFVQLATQVQRLPLDHCDFLFQGFHETNRKFCGECRANTFKVFSEKNSEVLSEIIMNGTTEVSVVKFNMDHAQNWKLPSTMSLAVEVFSLFPKRSTQVYSPASES